MKFQFYAYVIYGKAQQKYSLFSKRLILHFLKKDKSLNHVDISELESELDLWNKIHHID